MTGRVERQHSTFLVAGLVAVLVTGCGTSSDSPSKPEPLRIAAASDLRTVLPKLIEAFSRNHAIAIEPTFGASGQLAQQIRQGAPFDLFLAANRKFVADLAASGDVRTETVHDYARGTLVLAVHDSSAPIVKNLADLARPEVQRIALANPDLAPYGLAGKQVLERSKLWDVVQPRLAQSETVAQALQFVRTGNAEVGFVGKAIADVPGVRTIAIDESLYDPLIQGLGVITRSKNTAEAEEFAQFLQSAEGQSILREAGFGPPSEIQKP